MSVYKHPSRPGAWMIKISHGRSAPAEYFPFDGDYESAKLYERELRGEVNYTDPAFCDHLPEFKIAYRNRSRPRSYESLETSFGHLEEFFGNCRLRHITPSLVEQYKAKRLSTPRRPKDKRTVSKRTVNVELSALSAYVGWVNETYGTSFQKPKLFARKETKPPLPQVLTPAELGELINNLQGEIRTIVELMATCGLRRNEALTLTAKDIDLAGGMIRVIGKGGKWRLVPICLVETKERLAEMIKERPDGWLFPSPVRPGDPRKDIRKPIRAAAKAAGITKHIHPHLLRHSFGAALVNGGADIRIIQELLGHSEVTTTQIYTQVAEVAKRQAVDRLVAMVAKAKTEQPQGVGG